MNILIAENEIQTAQMLKRIIKQNGHQCTEVSTGREAINKFYSSVNTDFSENAIRTGRILDDYLRKGWGTAENSFDIVLLNIWLPDIKGNDLIPELKKYVPDIKIIAMTDLNDRELEIKIRQHGVIYYLIKPFEFSRLQEILDHTWKKIKQENRYPLISFVQ